MKYTEPKAQLEVTICDGCPFQSGGDAPHCCHWLADRADTRIDLGSRPAWCPLLTHPTVVVTERAGKREKRTGATQAEVDAYATAAMERIAEKHPGLLDPVTRTLELGEHVDTLIVHMARWIARSASPEAEAIRRRVKEAKRA